MLFEKLAVGSVDPPFTVTLEPPPPPDPQVDPVGVTIPETSSRHCVPVIADRVRVLAAENVQVPLAVGDPLSRGIVAPLVPVLS